MLDVHRNPTAPAALVAVALLAVTGCAGRPHTQPDAARVAITLPSDLVVMPIGDERERGPQDFDLARDVRTAAARVLGKKGYAAVARDEIADGAVAAPRTLEDVSGADLAALGPNDAGALVYISVSAVEQSYDDRGESFVVTLTGLIVDPGTGRIVWRSTGTGQTSLRGFFRIFTPQSRTYDAVYDAVRALFHTLPQRDE